MKNRFLWLLIFVCINLLVLLTLALFYIYVHLDASNSLYFYIILLFMLLSDVLIFVFFFLPEEKTAQQSVEELHQRVRQRAGQILQDPLTTPPSTHTAIETNHPENKAGIKPAKKNKTGTPADSRKNKNIPSPVTAPPAGETASDIKAEMQIDSASLLAARYPQSSGVNWPIQTYIAGTWLPGTLMGYYPGDPGSRIVLVREKSSFDPDAVRVCLDSGHRIGWIPRPLNRTLARILDQGGQLEARLLGSRQVCQSLRMDIEIMEIP